MSCREVKKCFTENPAHASTLRLALSTHLNALRAANHASRVARSLSIISWANAGLQPPWTPLLVASAGTCLLGSARTVAFLPAEPRSSAAAAATSSASMLRTDVVLDVPFTAKVV